MHSILVLKSSIMGDQSHTNGLIDTFLSERRARGLQDNVVVRDLVDLNLPVLDAELFSALRGGENPSQRARAVVALSDQLIAELKASDLLVIGAPMYNHNVPTHLKNWFDLVARARVTFNYTATYPMGLVEGVRALVFSSRGGVHVGSETDAVTPYLRSVLGLMGIKEVQFVYAEGLDMKPHGRDSGLAAARHQIVELFS
ncbi:FMN-dependent NADH-azoreductase [Serratia liquefaciens]|uniref:FMN-dependent NADH-azoreductase n=1 Tax=Serratia liquefaciens TaxID=614 RepID=UPI001DF0F3B1|nr:NAD(P)H-dependent oxidoreductase [Serratia liquefaciens]NLU16713.1 FMN-dependent NADH-azoreductase [Serratia liquefaciens]WBL73462.1 NAD(P)H-dependent oxidoreductase [Serratia liquefaciens]